MDLVSFKLPPGLRRRLAEEARRRRVSQAAVIRESLEAALERPAARGELTCADLAGDLIGSYRAGPRDASTNKRYLEEAIVADYFKGSKSGRRAKKRRR